MDAAAILEVIAKAVKIAVDLTPAVIQTVEDAKPFAQVIYNAVKGGPEITEQELLDLEGQLDALSQELQQPLPPDDDPVAA